MLAHKAKWEKEQVGTRSGGGKKVPTHQSCFAILAAVARSLSALRRCLLKGL